ncbi:hypothetical protein BaRGS_00010852 [Batillaria attramentaria]|uniref:Uncharacterized protein n=1 Tax=Batillaria attramentaria TaxID=370345 RepID=A0ABD0LET6_9CAEN
MLDNLNALVFGHYKYLQYTQERSMACNSGKRVNVRVEVARPISSRRIQSLFACCCILTAFGICIPNQTQAAGVLCRVRVSHRLSTALYSWGFHLIPSLSPEDHVGHRQIPSGAHQARQLLHDPVDPTQLSSPDWRRLTSALTSVSGC